MFDRAPEPVSNPSQEWCDQYAAWYDGEQRIEMDRAKRIRDYLELRDVRLLAQDGPARDSLEGCEQALRDVYLMACGKEPETD